MNNQELSDLDVIPSSKALLGLKLDVVVSGSIAAVESVRFIRALRRLSAQVTPWLTEGGARFISAEALSWAADQSTRRYFSGEHTHLASGDALIVAPASANFIAKIAHGISDSPTTALCTSYLGVQKPVFFVPNMHSSLADSPLVARNIESLKNFAHIMPARKEEGKLKFPDPRQLADQCAHILNAQRFKRSSVLINMGTTRAYMDDVRYISNQSTGQLGCLLSHELYRQGHKTYVVCGPCLHPPKLYSSIQHVVSNQEMKDACSQYLHQGVESAVYCAAILDFVPQKFLPGKIKSSQHSELELKLIRSEKIMPTTASKSGKKIAFKLESRHEDKENIIQNYLQKYQLSLLVYNELQDLGFSATVSENPHKALAYTSEVSPTELNSKQDIVDFIVQHLQS